MYRHNYNPSSKLKNRKGGAEVSSSFHSGYGGEGGGVLSSSRSLLSSYKRSDDPRYSSSDRLLSLYRTSASPSIISSSRVGTASNYRYPSGGLIRRSTSYSSGLGSLLAESGRVAERPVGLLGRNNGVGDRDNTSRNYRSRTPPNPTSQLSLPTTQHQRESRSLGRDEGGLTTGEVEDNVERTFEKLYKKYVLDSGVNLPAPAPSSRDDAANEIDVVGQSHKKRGRSDEGQESCMAELPPIVQPTPVEEAREIKPPASQIGRSLRLMDFDPEKFKAELKRTLGREQLLGDTSKYRALSASPGRDAAVGSKDGTAGGRNHDGSTTGNQLDPSNVERKSKSESPAPRFLPVCGNAATAGHSSPVGDTTKSGSPVRTGAVDDHKEVNSGSTRSNTRSRSRSKSRDPEQVNSVVEENNSATSKKTQRMERTLENLFEKLGSTRKEKDNLADGNDSKDGQRLKPPLLLVTQPSIPNTPITTAAEAVWSKRKGEMVGDNADVDSGEEEDANYSDEDEEYTDEEEHVPDNLCPTNTGRMRSVTPDFEFELPFLQADELRNDSRGRCSSADALPPPIFVASVSWDGDGADSWDSANEDSPGDEDEEANMLDDALRGSDDEDSGEDYSSSEYWSSTGEDESSDETTSSSYSDECLTVDDEGGSPGAPSRSRTASSAMLIESESTQEVEITRTTSLSPAPSESAREDGLKGVERETKSLSPPPPPQVIAVETIVAQTPVESLVRDKVELEVEELSAEEEPQGEVIPLIPTGEDVDLPAESKKINRTETYAKPQSSIEKVEKADHLVQQRKPRTDFAKKAVIQPMKTEKIAVLAAPQPQVKVEEKPVEKKMVTSSQERMAAADRPVTAQTALKVVPPVSKAPEDKSSMRKSTLNMADDEARRQSEQEQKERLQRTRGTNAVSAMMEKFKPVEPIKQEPITYKRSAMLEPKVDEFRSKKVYQPIVKLAANDEFEKQMAELRKQMKTKSTTLQAQYSTVRHGILSQADDAKLKAMKEKHASKLGTASNIFSRADDEKKRWKELHETQPEKKHRETVEKSAIKKLEEDNLKPDTSIEPRRTVRHLKKSEVGQPQSAPTTGPGRTLLPPEGNMLGSGIKERKLQESDSSSTATVSADKRLRKYSSRRKTDELMNYAGITQVSEPSTLATVLEVQQGNELDADASRARKYLKRKHRRHPNRRSHCHFTREPFDVDSLLGLSSFDTFEKMDAFFLKSGGISSESKAGQTETKRMRLTEHQKIWISELKDIDKLYKASELRDIKLTAEA